MLSLWPPSFDYAIFDFDGTLAATEALWEKVDRIFFGQRCIEYTPDVHQTLATLGFAAGAQWCIDTYGLRESAGDICDEWNRMGAALYASEARLRPGAEAYLTRLRSAGVPLALATTNDPQVLASMSPKVNVRELFDAVVCGHEVARPKDHPNIYLEAARRLGVDARDPAVAARGVVFEDILPGARSAKKAGFAVCAVGVEGASQPRRELAAAADLFIDGWE